MRNIGLEVSTDLKSPTIILHRAFCGIQNDKTQGF